MRTQWGGPVLLPKPESESSAHWNFELEVKHGIKFLLSRDQGVVTRLLSLPLFPCLLALGAHSENATSRLPAPTEPVTLGRVDSQALCWPAATSLKEWFPDSLACEPHCCRTMGRRASFPASKEEGVVQESKQS